MMADTAWLLAELVALFFGVAFIIQLVQRRLGPDRLRSWMGGRPMTSAFKGIAIGFVTPFCTYSAIPMLVGLRQAGVPPAGYVAFITAAPVLDPVLFGALVLIVGPSAAVLYAAIAFVGATTLATVAQRSNIEAHMKPLNGLLGDAGPSGQVAATATIGASGGTGLATAIGVNGRIGQEGVIGVNGRIGQDETTGSGGGAGAVGSARSDDGIAPPPGCAAEQPPWRGLRAEAGAAAAAAAALLRSVALLLVIGVGIGLVIEAAITPEDVAMLTGDNEAFSIPIAAALGTPLYFHTSLFVPIADALSNAGVGIGAIVALTIAGAGANVPEFIILRKLASARLIAIFVCYVFTVALVGGLLAQLLLG